MFYGQVQINNNSLVTDLPLSFFILSYIYNQVDKSIIL